MIPTVIPTGIPTADRRSGWVYCALAACLGRTVATIVVYRADSTILPKRFKSSRQTCGFSEKPRPNDQEDYTY